MERVSHYPRRDGPLPDGVRWVGRPSRWGNPFPVIERPFLTGASALTVHDRHGFAVDEFRQYALRRSGYDPAWLDPLRGATGLACACPLDVPCHVDVLIELLEEPF